MIPGLDMGASQLQGNSFGGGPSGADGEVAVSVGGFNVPAYSKGLDFSDPQTAVIAGFVVLAVGAVLLKVVRD